jgi:hypothetical protein
MAQATVFLRRFGWGLLVLTLVVTGSVPGCAQTLKQLNSPAVVPARVTSTPSDQVLTSLKGSVYPLARPQYDRGLVSDSLRLDRMILMLQRSPEQERQLEAVIDGLHNRKSPLYHHWLKPAQYGQHFGPADADIAAVTRWLKAHGFGVDQVLPGRTAIIFSGTAGQVRQAFHTEIHSLSVNGEPHMANMTEPKIPTALAPVVKGFRALHDFFPRPALAKVEGATRDPKTHRWLRAQAANAPPTAQFTDANLYGMYLVGPQDFYTIYNESPLLAAGITGAMQTIAVSEQTDVTYTSDVDTFRSQFMLPAYPTAAGGMINWMYGANGTFCSDPGVTSDETEALIDVEWAGAVASDAVIDFVSCAATATSAGIDLSAAYIVNYLAGTVGAFSESYNGCEWLGGLPAVAFYTDLWQQAAAEGQTVSISTGDAGSTLCDQGSGLPPENNISVGYISDTPYNIAAGGTDFSDLEQSNNYANGNSWWNTTESTSANGYESALSYVPELTWGGLCSQNAWMPYLTAQSGFGVIPSPYTPEAVCNWMYNNGYANYVLASGGTGGVSQFTLTPTWQAVYGVGDNIGNYTSGVTRNQPDLSFFASSGFWGHALPFCESDTGYVCDYSGATGYFPIAGGTSFVAPEVAGMMALVMQKTSSMQGNANYTLYNLAAQEYGTPGNPNSSTLSTCSGSGQGAGVGSTCIFYDIAGDTPAAGGGGDVSGTVASEIGQPCLYTEFGSPPPSWYSCYVGTAGDAIGVSSVSAYPSWNTVFQDAYWASQGYDAATGLGSANIANLVNNWNAVTPLFPTTTTVAASPDVLNPGDTSTLTATVIATGRGGFVAASGFVEFSIGSTELGQAPLSSTCSGTPPAYTCSPATATMTLDTTSLAIGSNSVTAAFLGDGANDASSSGTTVVTLVPYTLFVTANAAGMNAGATLPSFTYAMTGFQAGDTQGNSTSGQPALSTTTDGTTAGMFPINITAGTLTSAKYGFAFLNNVLSVNTKLTFASGSSGTVPFTLGVGAAAANPITLSCAGLPAIAQCSFSPATVNPSAIPAAVTLTISTTASAGPMRGSRRGRLGWMFAAVLPGVLFLPVARRGKRGRAILLWLALALLVGLSMAGCGSTTYVNHTVIVGQTYTDATVTVLATDGNGVQVGSMQVQLTVNP